jgi:hypothetical protein
MERDFQQELKKAQQAVKNIGAKRDELVGDARVEEAKVNTAVEQLKALGIENAASLSVADLTNLREQTQKELESNLDVLQSQITQGEALVKEYEAATA